MTKSTTSPEMLVVIPHYNRADTIKRAVDSILSQTYENFELLVVDDASEQSVGDSLGQDSRVKYFELRKNMGRYFIDAVASRANPYKYYMPHDSDDESTPDRFYKLISKIEETDADAVFNLERKIELDGTDHTISADRFHLPTSTNMPHRTHHSGVYKTDSLLDSGGYHPGYRVSYDTFLLNAMKLTKNLDIVEEPLYIRHRTEESLTISPTTGAKSLYRQRVTNDLHQLYLSCLDSPEHTKDIIESSISTEHKMSMNSEIQRMRMELGWTAIHYPIEDAEAS
ncbi:MAG: glycosyltransferase [Candidatus Saccharimonadales bacterium]